MPNYNLSSSALLDFESAKSDIQESGYHGAKSYLDGVNASKQRKPYLHSVEKQHLGNMKYSEVVARGKVDISNLGSLYLHFPFCTKSCKFCHYYKIRTNDADGVQEFPRFIVSELDLIMTELEGEKIISETIHFGGGTPSLLGRAAWRDFISQLRKRVDFDAASELAIEVDPADLTREILDFWLESGINRVSLGVQSFEDDVLSDLKREHTGADALAAIELLQDSGLQNINVDLMYGMPGRTLDGWARDIRRVRALQPQSITCYATRSDPVHSQSKARDFPDDIERVLAHQFAINELMQDGYIQYSPNQFIRDYSGACLAKNNRNRCESVLGVGPRAHSIFPGGFFESSAGVESYKELISSGKLPGFRGAFTSERQEKTRYLQFGLKLSGLGKPKSDNGVDNLMYEERFQESIFQDFETIIAELGNAQLLEDSQDDFIRLSHAGVLLADEVVKRFSLTAAS